MKKAHSIRSGPYQSECGNVFGLQAFLALDDGEFHLLSLGQGAVSLATNGTVVDKHISAALTLNEAIALGIVEPLHGSHFTSSYLNHIYNLQFLLVVPPVLHRCGLCATCRELSSQATSRFRTKRKRSTKKPTAQKIAFSQYDDWSECDVLHRRLCSAGVRAALPTTACSLTGRASQARRGFGSASRLGFSPVFGTRAVTIHRIFHLAGCPEHPSALQAACH